MTYFNKYKHEIKNLNSIFYYCAINNLTFCMYACYNTILYEISTKNETEKIAYKCCYYDIRIQSNLFLFSIAKCYNLNTSQSLIMYL